MKKSASIIAGKTTAHTALDWSFAPRMIWSSLGTIHKNTFNRVGEGDYRLKQMFYHKL